MKLTDFIGSLGTTAKNIVMRLKKVEIRGQSYSDSYNSSYNESAVLADPN